MCVLVKRREKEKVILWLFACVFARTCERSIHAANVNLLCPVIGCCLLPVG